MSIFDYVLCASSILQRVDEYTLYCHYLGYEPRLGKKYQSPVRTDEQKGDLDPSFVIYSSKYGETEYRWKDHGGNTYGDIFDLISRMHGGEPRMQTYNRVNIDFKLGFGTDFKGELPPKITVNTKPKPLIPAVIKIKSIPLTERGLKFWETFGITESTLLKFNVKQVDYYYINQYLKIADKLSFAYKIGTEYKLYFPSKPKTEKFRNNYGETVVEGWNQLPESGNLVLITKALKEVMYFDENFSIPAVAGKSENTMVPPDKIMELKNRFKHVVVFLDNDDPGLKAALKYTYDYGLPNVIVPRVEGSKDPTDHYRDKGRELNKQLIYKLLNQWLKEPELQNSLKL